MNTGHCLVFHYACVYIVLYIYMCSLVAMMSHWQVKISEVLAIAWSNTVGSRFWPSFME